MRVANQIVLASNSKDKLYEYQALFRAFDDIRVVPASKILVNADKLGSVENYSTYIENAIAKARTANHGTHYPCLGDDTGIEVAALGGSPGIYTHRYATAKQGVSQDQANREKLLDELKGFVMAKRNARFVTALALVMEGILIQSLGVLDGTIAEAPRGENGFGYDSIFIPAGHTKTLAEMSPEEKNSLSHRGLAVKELLNQVKLKGIVFAKP